MRRDQRDDLRYAGETILGRADWGDRESDYDHGFKGRENSPEVRWPAPERFRESGRSETTHEAREHWRVPGEHSGRGPRGYRRPDERIWEDVCDRLTDDGHVDATDVDVEVKDGEVTVEGTVRSRDEKRHAEDIIDSVPGVRDVHNRLRVNDDIIGRAGSASTPLDLSSPGGESRHEVENAVSARSRARARAAGSRGTRPR